MPKKIISFILIMLFCCTLSVFGASFSDVNERHSNFDAIYKMAEYGIVNGYEDGSFKPDNCVTRAEMCTFISRVFGYDKTNKLKVDLPFNDVKNDYWAIEYIKYSYSKQIINGMGDGTFLPAGSVTYEQAVKMLICAAGFEEETKKYSGDRWYSQYLEAASKRGMLDGIVIDVGKGASRADIVQLIYNASVKGLIDLDRKDDTDKDNEKDKEENSALKPDDDENTSSTEDDEVLFEEETVIKEVKTIVIDPGHNYEGFDKGARLEDDSVIEEIITWQISDKLRGYLEDYGFKVYLTREGEKSSIAPESVVDSLSARVDFANELEVDLFISIHCNTGGGTGVETYCFDLKGSSAPLSESISESISEKTGMYNRGAKEAGFYVIKNTVMPAVLVETGFIDNENDVKILSRTAGQKKIAKAIADAVYECRMMEFNVKKAVDDTKDGTDLDEDNSEGEVTEKLSAKIRAKLKTKELVEESDDEF